MFWHGRDAGAQTFALVYGILGVFLQAGYERNRFAGIARRLSQDAGLAVTIWRSEHNELDGEAGLGLIQERRLPDPELDATVNDEFLSGRAAVRYKHLFTAAASVQQSLEFLPNLEETSDFQRPALGRAPEDRPNADDRIAGELVSRDQRAVTRFPPPGRESR